MRAQLFVRGILSGLARKNSWTLAQYAGEHDPNGMQRLLTSAHWDIDGVRDDLRGWVLERLADPGYGVLVPVEASFPKRGNRSVGVHRRYSETAQRSENVQVGVFLGYASPRRWALVDRELYLPPSWTTGTEAGGWLRVPPGVRYATEPELALRVKPAVLRVFSLTPEELATLTPDDARDKYVLAARERNVRILYVRPFLTTPAGVDEVQANLDYVASIAGDLQQAGYRMGKAVPLPDVTIHPLWFLLMAVLRAPDWLAHVLR